MATTAHCAYCFECLSANLEKRKPLSLAAVEELWERYTTDDGSNSPTQQDTTTDAGAGVSYRPAAISRIVDSAGTSSASSSSPAPSASSSTPSLSTNASSVTTQSSKSSKAPFFSLSRLRHRRSSPPDEYPLFVTWDTRSRSGHKSLRGCIGTFEAQDLDDGLRTYAITSALEDTRFMPITARELPSLECSVTLLTDFESVSDPMDWQIGMHGLRISFVHNGRRYGSTYLPDVAREQGWTKDETLASLTRKAGWNGSDWKKLSGLNVVRYQGNKISLDYREWLDWKKWVDEMNVDELDS